ncbi:autotransporter domain-containing protein [Oleiagrimonas citrea]|uniref:Autotransporter domain-containing protein n=1 Tax=Oleiagrimonas citrea TaxID=1665687 RepID=A0A846ZQA3_9GAMM|nr:putative Ig domain-containing protein [Oleiagrimonas citrea]NKZ40112.1 autotransporter domain-containing protein [Oleiagrimonas citrea]
MLSSMTDVFRVRTKRSRVSGCMRMFSALLVLFAATMWSGTALANCSAESPINITVDSGATYTIDLTADYNDCAPAGIIMSDPVSTAHGTVTHNNAAPPNYNVQIYYANNGDGATSDTFTFNDGGGYIVTVNVTINPAPISVTPTTVSAGTAGTAYPSTNFTATGGTAPYTYSISTGSLPAGMNLSSNGTLSGTPTVAGTSNFTVQAKDANNLIGTTPSIALTVNAPTIAVTPNSVSDATVGVVYSPVSFTASGGATPYTYSVSAGSLPAGMNLSSNGTLSGTPTEAGPFNFTVQAKDANNFVGSTSSISMTVNAPTITVGPGAISNMQVGVPYSQQFTASGGTQGSGYTFAASGTVPAGLSLSSSGLLSGTPTSATSSASFTVTATDQSTGTGAPFSGSQGYTVSVAAPTLSISPVSGTTLTAATQNSSYSQSFTASGGSTPYNYQVTGGTLPNGLSLSNGGQLSGTPTEAGTFNFTVTATDSSTGTGSPFTVSGSYTLDVQPIVPVANPVTINVPYSSTANVVSTSFSGGTPTSVAVASPASHGTATASGTTITYTPTAGYTGADSFTYTGTNSAGTSAPATVSITVSAPTLAITSSSGGTSLTATVGQSFTQTFTFSGGKAPYQGYSITGIPAGLSVTGFNNTSITISGTPTVSGSFTLAVRGTDSSTGTNAPFTVNQSFALQINAASMSLSPGTLPSATAGTSYNQALTASGGIAPYTYAVTSGALPSGMSLSAAGVLSGTPSAAGTFQFQVTATDSSTGAGSPATASVTYNLTVGAPTIVLTPSTLPNLQQGTAFSQQLSASGGTAPYTYQVTSGSLPTGLTLSSSGLISGTPAAAGPYNFTVTATDATTGSAAPYSGSQAYAVTVGSNPPIVSDDTASTPSQQAVTIPVTSNDSGTINSIALASTPSHGTATVNGTSVVYTPTGTFFGTDTFTYKATGPGGTSAAATVTVTVTALAVPTAKNQSVTVLGGKSVNIDATAGASGGPYTSVAIATLPDVGTATVSGTTITYAAPATASGKHSFTYTLTNAYGTSQPATVAVQINPLPQAPDLSANAMAGTPVTVNLTDKATGGPFTGANLVSISPSTAGNGQIQAASGGGYQLQFTPSSMYSGTVKVVYTLKNAYATSANATVTIHVTARPDPSKDAEVRGLLNAQTDSTRRFARGQLDNFESRLEALHGEGGSQGRFSNSLSFTSASSRMRNNPMNGAMELMPASQMQRRYLMQPADADETPVDTHGASDPNAMHFWVGGAVNFGAQKPGTSVDGIDFNTSGISLGADRRLSSSFVLGAGIGFGHDSSDIGHKGSRSTGNAYSAAFYASYQPAESLYLDALAGYQLLSFDARRYVTANGNLVHGQRDGKQSFGALTLTYEYAGDNGLQVSPYGRLDMASATLDAYTESGDNLYSLYYERQNIDTTTGAAGVRLRRAFKRDFGVLVPMLRIEYRHDFQGDSSAVMRYADLLAGPLYRVNVGSRAQNHTVVGLGLETQTDGGTSFRIEYQSQFDSATRRDQSIQLRFETPFH